MSLRAFLVRLDCKFEHPYTYLCGVQCDKTSYVPFYGGSWYFRLASCALVVCAMRSVCKRLLSFRSVELCKELGDVHC